MAEFVAGNDPAEHTVAEVTAFLKGDDVTGDEYDRVMAAEREREGGGRVGIISLSGVETPDPEPTEAPEETPEQMAAHPEAANAEVMDTTTPDETEAPEPVEAPEPISAEEALRRAQANIDAQVQERLSRLG